MNAGQQPPRKNKREILLEALDQTTPAARAAYLDGACGTDVILRADVEALLQHIEHDSFLEFPAVEAPQLDVTNRDFGGTIITSTATEQPGDRIGRYKLLEQIGEGGFGVVYVAEQEVPVRRRVALKVIKMGMDTKQVIGRFEAERQALALMDHPNIAKVLDAGATETGRPYFVMELVKGERITDYCDKHNLTTPERIDLFVQICHAIQHAHQKGIIHRDIKPSNILVTMHDGKPVPKVIDFGIAKATEQRLTDKTVYTALEQMIGTPAYMSPEQAEMTGLDIDTRSDIYSLGVLLYELLTGKTPFDPQELMEAGIEAMRRTIREKEPQRPSTRLTTMVEGELTDTAKRRQTDAPKLVHLVRGDLDWIVMKCLEKDRTRRYETANGLASDLQRHVSNEPVLARPPSQFYRLQKLVRRNKLACAAAAAVALALLLGVVVSAWQAERAVRAEHIATAALLEEKAADKTAMANFKQAQKAVDDLMGLAKQANDDSLRSGPENTNKPLSLRLVDSAVENYANFLKQSTNNPDLKANLARLYQQQSAVYLVQASVESNMIHYYGTNTPWGKYDPKTGPELEAAARKALNRGYALLEELRRDFPSKREYQNQLADVCTTLGGMLAGTEGTDYLRRALNIREKLAADEPGSFDCQGNLADILSTLANVSTNLSEKGDYLSRSLQIRERLAKAAQATPDELKRSAQLAEAYEGQSDSNLTSPEHAIGWLKRSVFVRAQITTNIPTNSVAAPSTDTNRIVENDNLQNLAKDYQKLTKLLLQSGKCDEVLPLAQAWIQIAKGLQPDQQNQNEVLLASAYRTMADAQGKMGDTTNELANLELALKNFQHYMLVQRPSAIDGIIREHEYLDTTWEKIMDVYLDQSNPTQAIATARIARGYWSDQASTNPQLYTPRVAVAWWRLANLYQFAGQEAMAAHAADHASEIQQGMIKTDPGSIVEIIKILLQRIIDPNSQSAFSKDRFRGAFLKEAMESLETIVRKTDLVMPNEFLSLPQIHLLETQTNFTSLLAAWKAHSPSTEERTNSKPSLLAVTLGNIPAILAAAHNKQNITLKGVVQSTSRSRTGRTIYIEFMKVPQSTFKAVVYAFNENNIGKKLGGLVEEVLPGATLTVSGVPTLYNDNLQLNINQPEQIIAFERAPAAASSPGNTSPPTAEKTAWTNQVLNVANTSALIAKVNDEVAAEGRISQAEWIGSGRVFLIEFQNTPTNGLTAVIFKANFDDIIDGLSLAGNPSSVLPGKSVRIRGKLVLYRGHPEFIISQPDQLTILETAASASGGPAVP